MSPDWHDRVDDHRLLVEDPGFGLRSSGRGSTSSATGSSAISCGRSGPEPPEDRVALLEALSELGALEDLGLELLVLGSSW